MFMKINQKRIERNNTNLQLANIIKEIISEMKLSESGDPRIQIQRDYISLSNLMKLKYKHMRQTKSEIKKSGILKQIDNINDEMIKLENRIEEEYPEIDLNLLKSGKVDRSFL